MSDNTDDVVANEVVDADEAEAIAAAMAGYTARAQAPALAAPAAATEVTADAPPAPAADHGDAGGDEAPQPPEVPNLLDEPTDAPAPEPTLTQALAELRELKEAVKAAGGDADAIRKLHGEIGSINRMLQQMGKTQAAPTPAPAAAPAPVDDELTAALRHADEAVDAFPEVGGPLVAAIRAVATRPTAAPSMSAEEISALVQQQAQQAAAEATAAARVKLAQDALQEEHPDWHTVRDTPAFQKWFSAQPEEYRTRLNGTWNPAVVAKGLTEFKTELQRQQEQRAKKQSRLEAAVTPPRGNAANPRQSTIPDEDAAMIGYASVRRLNSPTLKR